MNKKYQKDTSSREELKELIDSIPQQVWTAESGGSLSYINKTFLKYAGVSEEVGLGEGWHDLIHPDDLPNVIKKWSDAVANAKPYEAYFRIKRWDGVYLWHVAQAIPKLDSEGLAVKWFGTCTDISEHEDDLTELRRVSSLLDESQQLAKFGGWELAAATGEIFWTDQIYRIFDTSPEKFNPNLEVVADYFLPESKKTLIDALDAAINHGIAYDLELETYTTKGRKIDVRATCKVISHEGKVIKLNGLFQDISAVVSQRKETEKNFQRLQVATDAAQLGVWEYNISEQSLIWDKRMYELYGVTTGQFTEAYSFWENALSPKDMKQALSALSETINSKHPFKNEFRVLHPDGSLHWIAANGYPIEDASGQVVKIIGTNQSIDSVKEYEERIETSHKFSNTGSWEWNIKTGDRYWSPMVLNMFGRKDGNPIVNHESFVSAVHPDDRQFVEDSINSCVETGQEYDVTYRIVQPNGTLRWLAVQGNVARNSQGDAVRVLGMVQDITKRKQTEDELLTRGQIITNMEEGASLVRVSDQTIVYTNPAFDKMFGYEQSEINGQHCSTLIAPSDISPKDITDDIISELEASGVWRGEIHNIKKDGATFWCSATISTFDHPVYGNVWVSVLADITERKSLYEQLSYQASHDALTGLISRYEFEKRIIRVLSNYLEEHVEHAMCFLDLDQFKVINDTCGHAAGDELLGQIGRLLRGTVRKRDTLARLGGDEFGVLMAHCTLEQARRTANNILEAIMNHQFNWGNKTFRIGVSIGLVAITKTSGNFTDLLRQADAACYLAKDLGRNRIHIYHPDDTELAVRHGEIQWVGRISRALDEDRFCLYAQPIVSLDSDHHKHYELLVRMLDEDGGIIPPGSFLPAAERYNLIEKLDVWVVCHACVFLAKQPAFIDQIEFVSINLSGQSLTSVKFLESIINIFKETGVPPGKVCFEITETAAVSNMDLAIKFINTLKEIGCQFALDDFGSGISSFGYLKNLPVDFLKIDGMFVKDIVEDKIDYAMVKSINEIGQLMGMKTIAEFVENEAIKTKLKSIGVNYGQGYGLGRPKPIEDLIF
jgi:diguanylate cyclase (GGDEF)-like protein/PAS domain S-box-containing protein